jgi:tight adherence protein C
VWVGGLTVLALLMVRWFTLRQRVAERVFAIGEDPASVPHEDEQTFLARWLFDSGFRQPNAVAVFTAATLLCALIAGVVLVALHSFGVVASLSAVAISMPGGVGEVLLPMIYLLPWLFAALLIAIPALVVRAVRRRRVIQIKHDLPLTLELLATLAEAGLGLDAAIDRILQSVPPNRILPKEFRAFQRDNLAGRPRVESLRWLGRRVAVSWFSIFISAVVQAEQIGASLADVLRIQAYDLRQRRKEEALALAASTPVKLILPMVICFMPGIFLAALGPMLYEVFQSLDNFTQSLR